MLIISQSSTCNFSSDMYLDLTRAIIFNSWNRAWFVPVMLQGPIYLDILYIIMYALAVHIFMLPWEWLLNCCLEIGSVDANEYKQRYPVQTPWVIQSMQMHNSFLASVLLW